VLVVTDTEKQLHYSDCQEKTGNYCQYFISAVRIQSCPCDENKQAMNDNQNYHLNISNLTPIPKR
jgi:hypothetical protein